MKFYLKVLLILLSVVIFAGLPKEVVFADDLATQCATISESSSGCSKSMSDADCKELLQKCSDYYDEQSSKISEDITKTAAQKTTLQNQVSSLKSKIQGLTYQINQSSVKVKSLGIQIADTQSSIDKTSKDINDSHVQMAEILRTISEEDKKPSLVILLEGDLSDFFSNIAYLENLNSELSDLIESTINLQTYLGNQKNKMDNEVDSLQKTIALQSSQKQESEKTKTAQESYLQLTEAQYQAQIANKSEIEKKKAKIQALLFSLAGTSDTQAPTFGEAIEIAKSAANLVGIRPAFLLAIISQESAIGRNVGQCYLSDPDTGNGKKISTGVVSIRVMKPTRDVQPFITITKALGRDPYATPISCWIPAYVSGYAYGWGGAMGPAQFIASTWNLFADRLKKLLGKTADPWAIKDAFTASGLYLADLGATKKTAAAEKAAASKYYGGSSAYANSVYTRATCIQTFIDEGTMSSYCEGLIF
jgi:peptidoglycan hydrolase CwlO-like protein